MKNSASPEQNRKRIHWYQRIGVYLWMAPALILVFFFIVLPTLQTVYLSLNQEVTFSESEFRQEFLNRLKSIGGKEVLRNDLIQEIPGWEKVVRQALSQYGISNSSGAIRDIKDSGPEMTVKDTAELLTMTINQAQQTESGGQRFAGLKNYVDMFQDSTMLTAFKNNLIWLFFFTLFTVILGLLIAALADRVRWSTLAKTIIFLPMAISGAAAAVIWNFMYSKDVSTGTVNAVANLILNFSMKNFAGIAFLGRPDLVNIALIIAGVWMQVGFCTVIFSAALKSVSVELLEMARIEGANSLQVFFKIELPIIQSTVVLVITQMIIWVLKVFDIIYTLTQGGPFHSSEVIANRMYMTAFNQNNFQYAAAMAVILFIAIIPVLLMNIRNLAHEESVRE